MIGDLFELRVEMPGPQEGDVISQGVGSFKLFASSPTRNRVNVR